ncbi:MAG: hypothetical protein KME57_09400 [Scytonema hyalinum WJT4-NPBG1]|jgi:hypothetical protein|nr:hypothetical protein [Scytonema hyalinum WJT4-NPBG1]
MATSTDNSTVLVSDSVIPSVTEVAGAGGFGDGSQGAGSFGGGSQGAADFGGGSQGAADFGGDSQGVSGFGGGSQGAADFGGDSQGVSGFGGGSQGAADFGGGSQGAADFGGGSQGAGDFGGGSQAGGIGGGSQAGGIGDGSQAGGIGGGSQAGGIGGGSQAGSSNPISGGAGGSSNPFSASQGAGGFGGSSLQSLGLGTGSTNTFTGAANNPYAGGGGEAFGSLGNVVVGNNEWIIGKEITPERFSKAINFTVEETVDSVIGKLSNRLSENGIVTSSSGGNPFAGGNNPFGTTNAPALDYLKQAYGTNFPIPESASNFTASVYSQTLPGGSGTSAAGAPTTGTSDGNPLVPSGNTAISGSSQPSLDIVQVLFGDDLKGASGGSGKSPSETLRVVQDSLLNFTKTVNSATGKRLFSTNSTPLQSPSDLLTLYKNDIVSANTGINNANELAGGSGDPYSNLLAGSGSQGGSQAVQPPTDILSTVLGGLLPFSGSDNIFNTPEGGIPVGYGNKDFGGDNAVIGNANWNYGQSNVSVGNANWNWDSSKNNATIGNGNWHLDNTQNNRTIGNGNWYWESTSDNKTLGNGNWSFGNNNTTIGNGNWDYGSNNTIIGNGNQVFTSNSVVIGNGNWSVIIDKSNTAAGDFLGKLDNLVLSIGVKDAADNLVNSLFGKFADAFQPLTSDFSESTRKSYDQFYWDPTTVG